MMYIDFETRDKTYKLRLTTQNVIKLEAKLGKNPLSLFTDLREGNIPTLTDMIKVFHASLLSYYDDITEEKACEIFDSWIDKGNTLNDFIEIMIQIFQQAGLIEKN